MGDFRGQGAVSGPPCSILEHDEKNLSIYAFDKHMKTITQLTKGFRLALVAAFFSSAAGQGAPRWTVAFDGYGPIRIGMTVPQAEKAAGFELQVEGKQLQTAEDSCHHVSNLRRLPGLAFMVEDGKIARIDIFGGRSSPAPGGGRVGMTEAQIKKLYPTIQTKPHHYVDGGHYLIQDSPDGRFALLFETEAGAVVTFRVGLPEPVGYVEGCL